VIEEQVPSALFGTASTPHFEDHASTPCPNCKRNDMIARVSSIARSGRGRLLLEDGSAAEFESELAAMLGEPERPRPLPLFGVVQACVFSLILLGIDLAIVALLRWQDIVSIPSASLSFASWGGIVWFGVLVPLVAAGRYLGSRDRAAKDLEPWQESMLRWRDAYYCSRDDVVFLPNSEGSPVAPENAEVLWTRTEAPRLPQRKVVATSSVIPPRPRPATGGTE
jgi:hypothetical protein